MIGLERQLKFKFNFTQKLVRFKAPGQYFLCDVENNGSQNLEGDSDQKKPFLELAEPAAHK